MPLIKLTRKTGESVLVQTERITIAYEEKDYRLTGTPPLTQINFGGDHIMVKESLSTIKYLERGA